MATKHSRSGTSPGGDDIEILAAAIRTARQQQGLTQAQLAGLSGTGLRFIGELEAGKPTVTLNKVVAVLATLGLRLSVTMEPGA